MPSQERKPVFLSCMAHSRMDLRRAKPTAAWKQGRKSFVSQICFTVDYSSWDKTCCLGIRENHYDATTWEVGKTVQYDKAAKKKENGTKDSLPLQNLKMIPSMLISQMNDENKSKENKTAFSKQSIITQSDANHMNQSLANHSSVNINRAFVLLPRRLRIRISPDDNVFGTNIDRKEDKRHNQKKGFASITITARRVVSPCKSEMKVDPSNSSCLKCQESNLVDNTAPVAGLDQLCGSLHAQGYCQNQNATTRNAFEPCSLSLCKEHSDWVSSTENRENKMVPPGKSHSKEAAPSFTSNVHLSISTQCPKSIYYIDKSLSVPVIQPQTKYQKIHRSVVSFNINCSSRNLTPDGVDGSLANGKLITEVLKTKLPEDSKIPVKAIWNADLKENFSDKKQTLQTDSLGTGYPWKVTTMPETLLDADSPQGLSQLRPPENNDENSHDNHITMSSHSLHWIYNEGTQAFSEINRQLCTRDKYHETASASNLQKSSKTELMVEGRIYLEDKHLPKGTAESKTIQAQSFIKPKRSISDNGYHTKFSSNTAVEKSGIHRKDPFPKGDYIFCASAILKEHKQSEKNEMISRVTTSTAQKPDVPLEKHEAFQQPEVCSEPEKIPANPLTLREALEVHKPHFICRSQERLKKLEHMIEMRKTQQGNVSGGKQALLSHKLSSSSITSKKKQYTVPHPLSDNLFKPKERFISEKEMHMRSKRIYNNLPEVKKKQEEKQKQILLQSNRMRVEVFKKQLLDQLLQRSME